MAGLQKIKIPYKPNEITEEIITRVLPNVFNAFVFNAEQIRADYDTYLLQHDILSKERLHDDSETNNIVLEPHIFNMVSWKSGYVMGNPIKYAQTKSLETDDIQQLNIFLKETKSIHQGTIPIKMKGSATLPLPHYDIVEKVLDNMNIVLNN